MRLGILLIAASLAAPALAQRPDCPPEDAPMPTQPPGGPPPVTPKIDFPLKWGDSVEPPKSGEIPRSSLTPQERASIDELAAKLRANDDLLDAEDGHVAGLVHLAKRAVVTAPPGATAWLVDASKIRFTGWQLVGYLQEGSPNRISRLFKRGDGSLVYFKEWNFGADGGAVHTLPGFTTVRVGRHDASPGGVRGRSGCIQATLTWQDERKHYELAIVGPLGLREQRALLLDIANSVAAVAETSR